MVASRRFFEHALVPRPRIVLIAETVNLAPHRPNLAVDAIHPAVGHLRQTITQQALRVHLFAKDLGFC